MKCAALDINSKRCGRLGVNRVRYHGDPELYDLRGNRLEPSWVVTHLCNVHSSPANRKKKHSVKR